MDELDNLHSIIQICRNSNESSEETITYLFHVDRLLVKIREHLLTLRYHEHQFSDHYDLVNRIEFLEVKEAAIQCYNTMTQISVYVKNLPKKITMNTLETLVNLINILELDATSLGSAMRVLNQFCYRQEAIVQFAQLEQNLMNSIVQSQFSSFNFQKLMTSENENLRARIQAIPDHNNIRLIKKLIEIHDMLRKCYVVARKAIIKETLDNMGNDIEALTILFLDGSPDKNQLTMTLCDIYHDIESLRFSSNRESHCSKNLFDKAKLARNLLRKACVKHPLGREFISQISVKRDPLIKSKDLK